MSLREEWKPELSELVTLDVAALHVDGMLDRSTRRLWVGWVLDTLRRDGDMITDYVDNRGPVTPGRGVVRAHDQHIKSVQYGHTASLLTFRTQSPMAVMNALYHAGASAGLAPKIYLIGRSSEARMRYYVPTLQERVPAGIVLDHEFVESVRRSGSNIVAAPEPVVV